jgi:transposase-like protein
MKQRRKFCRELKLGCIRELEAGRSTAEVCRRHEIHPGLLSKWKREYAADPDNAFSGSGNTYKPEAKLAEYERLIGTLYAENAF